MIKQPNKNPVDLLLPYQVPHVYQLYEVLLSTQCALDGSDTGTGKTYVTMAVCHLLGLKPFIICPKSVISSWTEVSKKMGVEIVGLSNYEKLKNGKYYTQNFEIVVCPFMDKIDDTFIFQFPLDTIVIVDEAHKCKNHKSENSSMILALKQSQKKMLLLSATITDKMDCFKPFGVMFGFYSDIKNFKTWSKNNLAYVKSNKSTHESASKKLHNLIYPNRGSRMKIKELGSLFPQNQIIAKCYYMDQYSKVDEIYKAMNDCKTLGDLVKCRMLLESLKLQIIVELTEDALDSDYSVAIFVNFRESFDFLTKNIKEKCSLIHGDQTLEERQSNIKSFQLNETKVIISIMQAGGVGISLHDLNGRPRMSIISPNYNGVELMQCLGRIHRAGSLSPALQRIVYIAKSCEEKICSTLNDKLKVLSSLNDGEISSNIKLQDDFKNNKINYETNSDIESEDERPKKSSKNKKIKYDSENEKPKKASKNKKIRYDSEDEKPKKASKNKKKIE